MSSDDSRRRVVLVVGGVRSGKSRYAQERAKRGERVAVIATAEARDEDMRHRIERHRRERPSSWTTVEAPVALPQAIADCGQRFDTILIDCLTLWASNLLEHEAEQPDRVQGHVDRLCHALARASASVIVVSNEVGSGIVPDNELGRTYRDLLGGINQRVAAVADEVILLVAGCPMVIKQALETTA